MYALHRILGTKVVLKHMGIENDSICSFCKKKKSEILSIIFFGDVLAYTNSGNNFNWQLMMGA